MRGGSIGQGKHGHPILSPVEAVLVVSRQWARELAGRLVEPDRAAWVLAFTVAL